MIAVPDLILSKMAVLFGTDRDSLSFFAGGREDSDGALYTFHENGSEKVLKILAIPVKEKEAAFKKIDERIKFVHFLGENGVDIIYPVVNRNNMLMETVEGDTHIFVGYVMNRIDGIHPSMEECNPHFFMNFGRAIGRLHRITKQYPKWKGNILGGDCEVLGWQEELDGFYEWCKDEDIKKCWLSMKNELLNLPITRDTYGFIHNDPHIQNIMKTGDRITLIDFDVANFHWFATDISIAPQSVLFSQSGGFERPVSNLEPLKIFFDNFMNGYEMENHLDELFIKKM
ncbi:MAG: phosphotransferase, partial [Bacillota bacterium]|nr:phosphotransferase [Bacillota bacterium]